MELYSIERNARGTYSILRAVNLNPHEADFIICDCKTLKDAQKTAAELNEAFAREYQLTVEMELARTPHLPPIKPWHIVAQQMMLA
jgi:hypothetical protein